MLTQIYDLAYEVDEDGSVQLEQSAGCGEVSRITLHPIHVRLLAEEAGILAPSSNIEADRTIARLCRQMRILHARINQLDDWLNETAQRGHEDLESETAYSFATWELASEFIADLPATGSPDEQGKAETISGFSGAKDTAKAARPSDPAETKATAGKAQTTLALEAKQ